jgi:hypothetical protein
MLEPKSESFTLLAINDRPVREVGKAIGAP